jgi:hypothetical protein
MVDGLTGLAMTVPEPLIGVPATSWPSTTFQTSDPESNGFWLPELWKSK